MQQLVALTRLGALVFLVTLAFAVLLKLLRGTIPLNGLLDGDRCDGTSYFSVGRTRY